MIAGPLCPKTPFARPCSPPPASARGSCRRPRRSPRKCCRSSTSRSSSTASRRRCASGVDNIILVTGRGKNAIEDHFDVSVELETFLESRGKTEQLAEIRKISNLINVSYVRQGEPLGLGHAVLVTTDAGRRRTLRRHPGRRRDRRGAAGAAPDDRRVRGGATDRCSRSSRCRRRTSAPTASSTPTKCGPGVYQIRDLVEKPPLDEAPSNLAIIGRYILTPDIFPALEETAKDRTGEIQLTNGLRRLLKKRPIYGCRDRRRPPRHRQQARVPQGGGLLRAAPAGSRGAVPRVPARPRPRRADGHPPLAFSCRWSWSPLSVELDVLAGVDDDDGRGRAAVAALAVAARRRRRLPLDFVAARLRAGAGLGRGLLGVVGDVEARPLELDRGGRGQFPDRALAARRAGLGVRIRDISGCARTASCRLRTRIRTGASFALTPA